MVFKIRFVKFFRGLGENYFEALIEAKLHYCRPVQKNSFFYMPLKRNLYYEKKLRFVLILFITNFQVNKLSY